MARIVAYDGEDIELAELCRRFGVDRKTVSDRLDRGMSLHDALTQKRRRYPRKVKRAATPGPPATPLSEWHRAIEASKPPERLPEIDEAAELITLLMEAATADLRGSITSWRARLLARGRAWLLRVGWQR